MNTQPHRLGVETSTIRYARTLSCVALSISLSLMVTLLALAVGHAAAPTAYLPRTAQMLGINIICDGLTIYTTFVILKFCIQHIIDRQVVIYVTADIVISAFLAFMSLYLGLLGSAYQLSSEEVLRVLVGHSVDGYRWEIGPLFWVMHTTFIPTTLCMFFVIIAVTGKVLCRILMKYGEVASVHKRPFALTSALCGVFVAFFAGSVVVIEGVGKTLH